MPHPWLLPDLLYAGRVGLDCGRRLSSSLPSLLLQPLSRQGLGPILRVELRLCCAPMFSGSAACYAPGLHPEQCRRHKVAAGGRHPSVQLASLAGHGVSQ